MDDYPLVSNPPFLQLHSASSNEHLFASIPGIDGLVYCSLSDNEELAVIGFVAVGIIQSPSDVHGDRSTPYVLRGVTGGVAGNHRSSSWDKMMTKLAVSEGDLACRRRVNTEIFAWASDQDEPDLVIHRVRAAKMLKKRTTDDLLTEIRV